MTFYELVKRNRSYRAYDRQRKITREELEELVDCARITPSAANRQPFRYDLVCGPDETAKVQALTKWAAALPERNLPDLGKEAAAFVIILQETEWVKNSASCQIDVGIAAQTLLLAAVDKGLGGLMIGNFNREAMKELRGYPEDLVPQLVIALGKPAEKIELTDVLPDGSTKYYRDAQDVHYVPKRRLQDVIWEKSPAEQED